MADQLSTKVAQLASNWKFVLLRTRTSLKHSLLRNLFSFAHLEGFPVCHLRWKFRCCAGCLRWSGGPWVTEIWCQALHTSPVDFSHSRDSSNSKNCSIRCQTKSFPESFWSPDLKILHQSYHTITVGHLYRCENHTARLNIGQLAVSLVGSHLQMCAKG